MNEQEQLEAKYRAAAKQGEVPQEDPFPRMIIVCIGITMFLLMVIMGFLFVDFVIGHSRPDVRPPGEVVQPVSPAAPRAAEKL